MAIRNHRQTNDLGTGFEIAKWEMFYHQERLQISPACFKQGYSDSAPLAVMELRWSVGVAGTRLPLQAVYKSAFDLYTLEVQSNNQNEDG